MRTKEGIPQCFLTLPLCLLLTLFLAACGTSSRGTGHVDPEPIDPEQPPAPVVPFGAWLHVDGDAVSRHADWRLGIFPEEHVIRLPREQGRGDITLFHGTRRIYENLGSWSKQSDNLAVAVFPDTGPCPPEAECIPVDPFFFGVAARNGLVQRWATGIAPFQDFQEEWTLGTRGTWSWSGILVGLTPGYRAVVGRASLWVNTRSFDGELNFSELEFWTGSPVELGTGALWRDGDLQYAITVRGNTFVQTGGDDGVVTGVFLGSHYDGMAGTLKRNDLTAAFGGRRF